MSTEIENQIPVTQIETENSPTSSVWKTLFMDGVWKNNSALVQLLGLCPLLAVSNSVTNALGLGLATMFVLIATNTTISLFRKVIPMIFVFRFM